MLVTLIVFIFILGLLIFVHELGHFIMAKRSGIKVEEFAFGFPPRLIAFRRGETDYALNLLPFGGYVRMLGEAEDSSKAEKHNARSYAHQTPWVRAKVVIAGVVMNFLLGWVLISFGFMLGMDPIATPADQIPFAIVNQEVAIAGVAADSAAKSMGIEPGDQVVSINDRVIKVKDELSAATKELKGQDVTLKLVRKGQEINLTGKLGTGDAPLGVQLADETKVRLPIWWAPIFGVWETIKAAGLIFVGVLGFFKQLIGSGQVPEEAAGPVGIFYFTRTVLDLGFTAVLNFIAVLSINLGIINILPIPALDGGRLLFIILEKINRGKKVLNSNIENWAHTIGFVLLIIMILTITYNDILKLGR